MKGIVFAILAALTLSLSSGRGGLAFPLAEAQTPVSQPVPLPVSRIVSLSPATTEWVFALGLGAALVGRTEACDYPPEVVSRPSVGGFLEPNLAALLKLAPQLVLVTSDFNPRRVAELERAGLNVFRYDVSSLAALRKSTESLASHLGVPGGGREIVAVGEAALRRRPAGMLPFLGFVDLQEKYLVASGSFLGSLFEEVGLQNLLKGMSGYPQVSREFLRLQRPKAIVLFENPVAKARALEGPLTVNAIEESLLSDLWSQSSREIRIIKLPADLFLRPGPRLWTQGLPHLVARLAGGMPP